jgi:hypothetical protein
VLAHFDYTLKCAPVLGGEGNQALKTLRLRFFTAEPLEKIVDFLLRKRFAFSREAEKNKDKSNPFPAWRPLMGMGFYTRDHFIPKHQALIKQRHWRKSQIFS